MMERRDLMSFPSKPNEKKFKIKLFRKFPFNLQMKLQ